MTVRIQSEEEKITLKKYLTEIAAEMAQSAELYENQSAAMAAMAQAQRIMAVASLNGAQESEANALACAENAARCRRMAEEAVNDLIELEARTAQGGSKNEQPAVNHYH